MTAIIEMKPFGHGTRYAATVLNADTASSEKYAAKGFEQAGGIARAPLVALAPAA